MANRSGGASHHETMAGGQFGPHADNYVASPVHAEGADLARMAAVAAEHPGGRIAEAVHDFNRCNADLDVPCGCNRRQPCRAH